MQLSSSRPSYRLSVFQPSARPQRAATRASALFGFGKKAEKSEKELDKEEAYRVQQEEVAERRGKVSKYLRDPEYKKQIDAEKRERFKKAKEEADKQIPKFGIIVPLIPIGLPDYDIGEERFDLRLPHVDRGWEDEEIANDPLGLKQLGRAFGFGRKKDGDSSKDAGSSSGGKRGKK